MRNSLAGLFALALAAAAAFVLDAGAESQRRSDTPGNFDYYTLVLSWAPTFCDHEGDRRGDPHCRGGQANSFTLHGLWPQYERGWPSECYEGRRPWIPDHVLDDMKGIMPSRGLIIHEYRVHGTCSGLDPRAFFNAARSLYEKIEIPPALENPQRDILTSPRRLEAAFMQTNDWLTAPMISISCRSGDFYEAHICFDRELNPRACGSNQDQQRLCPLSRVDVPADPG